MPPSSGLDILWLPQRGVQNATAHPFDDITSCFQPSGGLLKFVANPSNSLFIWAKHILYLNVIKWGVYDTSSWMVCRKIPRPQRSHVLSPRHGFSILPCQKCFEPGPHTRLDCLLFSYVVQVSDIVWPKNLDFSPHDDPEMKLTECLVIIYKTY